MYRFKGGAPGMPPPPFSPKAKNNLRWLSNQLSAGIFCHVMRSVNVIEGHKCTIIRPTLNPES